MAPYTESREELLELLDLASDGMIVTDYDANFLYVNTTCCQITGYSREELLCCNASELVAIESRTGMEPVHEQLKTGSTAIVERTLVRKDGSRFPAEIHFKQIRGNRLQGIVRDISQRKAAEEELFRSSNFYLRIFDEFPAMIWRTDPSGHCDYFNKFWLAFTGHTLEQELGDGWLQGVHPEDREQVSSIFQEAFRFRRPCDMDYRLHYHGNRYHWVASTSWPFYNNAGDFAGFLTSSRDISDRKKAVEERIAILSRASQAERLATLGTLTAGIAHEINQPLNALKITADGILFLHKRGKIRPLEDIIRDVREISDCATQIDNIIKHMRAFIRNRRDSGLPLSHLPEALTGSLRLIGNQLSSHGVRLEKKLPSKLPPVPLTLVQLEQIIINLLVNAMQALDNAGKSEKHIYVTAMAGIDSVILEIADNGPGVPEKMREKIFEPFFTTRDTGDNMGLGLSIVASILNDCRGRVTVRENEWHGSTFQVVMPLVAEIGPVDGRE
ncbi:MAG TPA: PAS domain S-box protein [Patescibacteria group bacterium]|nr:PAS domain S-box protein [Patescibacteria group bacterium]